MPEISEAESLIASIETKLEIMWDKIQELKAIDVFAAQIMYEKYKAIADELPPPIPTDVQLMLPM